MRARPAAISGVLMTVGATMQLTPAASTSPARSASAWSITSVPTQSLTKRATPGADACPPSSTRSRSAGPFKAAPATIGDTATTESRRALNTLATPGTARIGPIDTTGFEGATTTISAEPRESSTPGAGLAVSAPSKRTESTTTEWRSFTKYSWKATSWVSSSRSRVRTGSSLIGSRRTPSPQAREISAVTSDSVAPPRILPVR